MDFRVILYSYRCCFRKLIKFSGPVSVVMFVPEPLMQTPGLSDVGEVESTLEERFLVVSSTLGPVAIWRCLFEVELFFDVSFVVSETDISRYTIFT